jgi:hypothetical protein
MARLPLIISSVGTFKRIPFLHYLMIVGWFLFSQAQHVSICGLASWGQRGMIRAQTLQRRMWNHWGCRLGGRRSPCASSSPAHCASGCSSACTAHGLGAGVKCALAAAAGLLLTAEMGSLEGAYTIPPMPSLLLLLLLLWN